MSVLDGFSTIPIHKISTTPLPILSNEFAVASGGQQAVKDMSGYLFGNKLPVIHIPTGPGGSK